MPALALSDEHPSLSDPHVLQPQAEDLAAAQPAQHHRRDHRPVPVRAQRRGQRVDLARLQDPRQPPPGPHQRHSLTGRCRSRRIGSPRGTGFTVASQGPAARRTAPTRSTTAAAPSAPTPPARATTSRGALPTTVKNTFRSYAVASTVFGRHRPATKVRYSSSSGTSNRTGTDRDAVT